MSGSDELALLGRIDAYLDVGRLDLARAEATGATEQLAESTWLWSRLALVEYRAQDYPAARVAAERALEIEPTNAQALFVLPVCLLLTGNRRDARAASLRFVEQYPDMPDALVQRAFVLAQTWRRPAEAGEAQQLVERAIELAPDQPHLYLDAAGVHLRLFGRKDYYHAGRAREFVQRGLEIDPTHEGLLLVLGNLSEDAEATKIGASVLAQTPDSPQARQLLHGVSWRRLSSIVTLLSLLAVLVVLLVASPSWRISEGSGTFFRWVCGVVVLVWVWRCWRFVRAAPKSYRRRMLRSTRLAVPALIVAAVAVLGVFGAMIAGVLHQQQEARLAVVAVAAFSGIAIVAVEAVVAHGQRRAVETEGLFALSTQGGEATAAYFADRWGVSAFARLCIGLAVLIFGTIVSDREFWLLVAASGAGIIAAGLVRFAETRSVRGRMVRSWIWRGFAIGFAALAVYLLALWLGSLSVFLEHSRP